MSQVKVFEQELAGRKLRVEVGKLAGQAHGSCTVQYGDTVILATAVQASESREGIDYFPLMVDYEERLYAAGKIKGSRFIKREGRPTDDAILTVLLGHYSVTPNAVMCK
jgi:polyribonucleotide nucleotidyltransferase